MNTYTDKHMVVATCSASNKFVFNIGLNIHVYFCQLLVNWVTKWSTWKGFRLTRTEEEAKHTSKTSCTMDDKRNENKEKKAGSQRRKLGVTIRKDLLLQNEKELNNWCYPKDEKKLRKFMNDKIASKGSSKDHFGYVKIYWEKVIKNKLPSSSRYRPFLPIFMHNIYLYLDVYIISWQY